MTVYNLINNETIEYDGVDSPYEAVVAAYEQFNLNNWDEQSYPLTSLEMLFGDMILYSPTHLVRTKNSIRRGEWEALLQ